MNAWVVLDPVTLAVVDTYASESSRKKDYSGYLNVCLHLPVPEGLDPTVIMAVREGDQVTLQADPAKVAAKTQAQWTSVRAQQRQKLYESDWTCSVTDYEVPNKLEWVQYRAQLRDVTLQSDPFAIVWPVAPEA
jgi:hypothetical protein